MPSHIINQSARSLRRAAARLVPPRAPESFSVPLLAGLVSLAAIAAGAAGASAVLTILVLLALFTLLYRRVRREATAAQALAIENERLLSASRVEARIDALTGLRNRRALMNDLDALRIVGDRRIALVLFDLNGFKEYNDSFGHASGDALLVRLGDRLAATVEGIGTAYRMGGDEFCVLAQSGADGDTVARLAAAALSDDGDAFEIDCAYGLAVLDGTGSVEDALHLADRRMYQQKASGRASASRQSADVLLTVLGEHSREVETQIGDVALLAELTAERLGLPEGEVRRVRLAAELHDIGKTAIPDTILKKAKPLDEHEWVFIRRHTLIGERIIRSAPSLAHAADLVRASHEHIDGKGYPDGLHGEEIPLGARIIGVCDAFASIVADRPYRPPRAVNEAIAELRRCAGTQFDPRVVEVFCNLIVERSRPDSELLAG